VVDDGSIDDTRERVARYGDLIRYVHKENGGQASALNTGLEHSRGELIALLDADDRWHPEKLAAVTAGFDEAPDVDVVVHYVDVVGSDGRAVGHIPDPRGGLVVFEPRPLAKLLQGWLPFYPPTSGITVRASCLRKISPFPLEFRICADHYVYAVLPLYVRQARLVPRALTSLRLHGTNVWTGTALTVPRLEAWVRFHDLAWAEVERHAGALGYDVRMLKRRFDVVKRDDEIQLHLLRGERAKALRLAVFFDDARPEASPLSRAVRRVTRIASVCVPPRAYGALRERYRNSVVFSLVHRHPGGRSAAGDARLRDADRAGEELR
jgi:glycosyltransferase involved in cell wall biosynthesis